MKVKLEFVPGKIPAEREAVELEVFPLRVHGLRLELVEREGPNGWPILTMEGPESVIRDLLRKAHVEFEQVEVLEEDA